MQRWLLSLLATAVAVVISYQWLDRPIALLVHALRPHREMFAQLTHIPDLFVPLAVVTSVGLGLWNLSGRTLSRLQGTAMICSISLIVAEATKNQLKFLFGRTWPETWVQNNASFIRDGAYGFNLFHGGSEYASFPSGHAAVTCAVISVLWISYPKLRPLYLMVALTVVIGLVGANFHFLSDVIAGAFVGTSTGWMAMALWQARESIGAPK
jgi:membrane-associated phospholipid phosphatase